MWRCVRSGSASGSGMNGMRQIACGIRLRRRLRGESLPLGDQEAICRDAETGMVMKASPAAFDWPSPTS